MNGRVPAGMTARARWFRSDSTEMERLLWSRLRWMRPRFTRQLVVGPYILDFACRTPRLVVELDGGQHGHEAGRAHDGRRDASLEAQGWTVLRVWNHELREDSDAVMTAIAHHVARLTGEAPHFVAGRERVRE